jgi:amino acid adenylation domain-containing protein
MAGALHQFFVDAAERYAGHTAVVEPGAGSVTYRKLGALSDGVRNHLHHCGVGAGDRVGVYMRKSIDTVAVIYGILKAGAVYVPVDPGAPPARNAFIMHDCEVKLIFTERRFEAGVQDELRRLKSAPEFFVVERTGEGEGLKQALEGANPESRPEAETAYPSGDELAYILYTSGSTGKPKGVMLTHDNAVSFINWCSETFKPSETDRFSSHAPFHFDLSILDLYLPLRHGASVVLVGEEIGKDPVRLAPLIAEQEITCWYSAPSILSLLAQYGNLAQRDYSPLRLVLFAGEVFPVRHLRTLATLLPKAQYFNLYGPTETNVCTFFEIPLPIPEERAVPFPIGKVCAHLAGKVIDESGKEVMRGEAGELCISGSNVMKGYWGPDELTSSAFITEASGNSGRWYRTGDIVVEAEDGNYTYQGRRDRMVKRRGYRVELGEIEAGLYRHPAIREAAVVAIRDEEGGVRIKAFLSWPDTGTQRPSIIGLKRFCSENLPLYMIPDEFVWCEDLPKTSTDKIDYQRLKEMY